MGQKELERAQTVMVFIGDATGRLAQLRLVTAETTLGYMRVLHDHTVAQAVTGMRRNGEMTDQPALS